MTIMKRLTAYLLLAAGLVAVSFQLAGAASPVLRSVRLADDFESGSLNHWAFPHPEDWAIEVEGGNHYLHMKRSREPGVPRRPLQFALLDDVKVGSFEFQASLRRDGRSMIVVFNYVDSLHFYYAHLSMDRGTEQPVHNGIFIVNGEPHRRIAGIEAPPALPDRGWHRVRVERDAFSGSIEVFIDDSPRPLFSVVSRTFTCGRIGIGSFDETGDFDDVKLISNDAGCQPGALLRPASAN
jgi:hypothetical protein